MNMKDKFDVLNIDEMILTDKKQQTDYKIKYVSEYVRRWAIISAEREEISTVTFIDCMCNAGVYKDGDCCTAIEVLQIFIDSAKKHRDKKFNLYLNDNNPSSIEILKRVIRCVRTENIANLCVYVECMDVNDYLDRLSSKNSVFGYGKSVVLYIDPFDFGTVHIPKIRHILERQYCEVIFNFFISDYVRNINLNKERIRRCIGNENIENKDDIIKYIQNQFRVGKMKYLFSYQFKTKTNIELYQIVFVTPSIKGLEKLKEVLWKVFEGKEFHRNYEQTGQMSLFTEQDEKEFRLNSYASEAKKLLCDFFKGKIVTYIEIEEFLIENTMLMSGQIINNVLKPLIGEKAIVKMGNSSKANYKKDRFKVGFVNEIH